MVTKHTASQHIVSVAVSSTPRRTLPKATVLAGSRSSCSRADSACPHLVEEGEHPANPKQTVQQPIELGIQLSSTHWVPGTSRLTIIVDFQGSDSARGACEAHIPGDGVGGRVHYGQAYGGEA